MLPSRPDCPECGEPLAKPYASCRCGWRAKKSNGSPYTYAVKVADHWIDKQCAWDDFGHRCTLYGPLSLCTQGEGPWYCRDHFADLMKWERTKVTTNLPIQKEAA